MTNTQVAAEVASHIHFKVSSRELSSEVGARMLAALDQGSEPDYGKLLDEALFQPISPIVYHTASTRARQSIGQFGLRMAKPAAGRFGHMAAGQPAGVYVAATPDIEGRWTPEPTWDIWAIDTIGLAWTHDRLNPGNWVLLNDVQAFAATLCNHIPIFTTGTPANLPAQGHEAV